MPDTKNKRPYGIQKKAVLLSMKTPLTGKQILNRAREDAPKITYADVRQILRKFEKDKLVIRLFGKGTTGRVYTLTQSGLAEATFYAPDFKKLPSPTNIDWDLYSQLSRSKALLSVLMQLGYKHLGSERKTPTQVKKQLLEKHPMSLSLVIASITRLAELELAKQVDSPDRDDRLSYYRVTPKGRIYVDLLESVLS